MKTHELIAESNCIEGITRRPLEKEIAEWKRFMLLKNITVEELERFVSVYQSNAKLRDIPGEDVRVGNHLPTPGGPKIREELVRLLERCNRDVNYYNEGTSLACRSHVEYEFLHPFTDCNGRSGRMLWYWMMRNGDMAESLGFLHTFYYQALEKLCLKL